MKTLKAVFVKDNRSRTYTGARCELPDGTVIETERRRVPLYDLARKLEPMGYGDWLLQAYTPEGTKSLRGLVKVMAGLTVEEKDKGGLRRAKYRPFPVRGRLTQRDLAKIGT